MGHKHYSFPLRSERGSFTRVTPPAASTADRVAENEGQDDGRHGGQTEPASGPPSFKRAVFTLRFSRTVMRVKLALLVLCLRGFFELPNAFDRASLESSELKMSGIDPQIA
jgi:hypothetical protein